MLPDNRGFRRLCGQHSLRAKPSFPIRSPVNILPASPVRESDVFHDFQQRAIPSEWESVSSDEMFKLHREMQSVLREKLIAKKQMLEDRLRQFNQPSDSEGGNDDPRQ